MLWPNATVPSAVAQTPPPSTNGPQASMLVETNSQALSSCLKKAKGPSTEGPLTNLASTRCGSGRSASCSSYESRIGPHRRPSEGDSYRWLAGCGLANTARRRLKIEAVDSSKTEHVPKLTCRAGGRERGRPAGRGAVTRDQCISASTRWGCSRTGPARSQL